VSAEADLEDPLALWRAEPYNKLSRTQLLTLVEEAGHDPRKAVTRRELIELLEQDDREYEAIG